MAITLAHYQIYPSSEKQNHELSLPLTHFDIPFLLSDPTQRLLFFDTPYSKSHFMETIVPQFKNSLSLALNHFLPLAGNILLPSNSARPVTRYRPGDSVPLRIAESEKDFAHLSGNHQRVAAQFYACVPELPLATRSLNSVVCPVLALQITLFPEQGICLGFTNSHAIADGFSIVNFINSWASVNKSRLNAQIAEGKTSTFYQEVLNDPDPDPDPSIITNRVNYDRGTIQDPDGLDSVAWNLVKESRPFPLEYSPNDLTIPLNKVRATFVMTRSHVLALKKYFRAHRPELREISSFTVICAYVWTCSEKSLGEDVNDDANSYFSFAAECRERLTPRLPLAYFGNCVVFFVAKLEYKELKGNEGFIVAAERIRDAIRESLYSERGVLDSADWPMDFGRFRGKRVMSVAGSPRFDVYNIDYGWGTPSKYEFVHIDKEISMSLCKSRKFEGGFEIGLSRTKILMDAFECVFNRELEMIMELA